MRDEPRIQTDLSAEAVRDVQTKLRTDPKQREMFVNNPSEYLEGHGIHVSSDLFPGPEAMRAAFERDAGAETVVYSTFACIVQL